MNREWPEGRGIFTNAAKTFVAQINNVDSFRLIALNKGADVLSAFSTLTKVSAELDKNKTFSVAHDEILGYISPCPSELGTNMRVSIHVHLPYLEFKKH